MSRCVQTFDLYSICIILNAKVLNILYRSIKTHKAIELNKYFTRIMCVPQVYVIGVSALKITHYEDIQGPYIFSTVANCYRGRGVY